LVCQDFGDGLVESSRMVYDLNALVGVSLLC
jgi:hypothetical protein